MKKGEDNTWNINKLLVSISRSWRLSVNTKQNRGRWSMHPHQGGECPSRLLVVTHFGRSTHPPTCTSTATSPLSHSNSTAAQKTTYYGACNRKR